MSDMEEGKETSSSKAPMKKVHEILGAYSNIAKEGQSDLNFMSWSNENLETAGIQFDHENKDWSPMNEQYSSFLNLGCAKGYLESALRIGGANETLKDYKSISEVPCPFDNGKGGCYKKKCPRKHKNPSVIEKEKDLEEPIKSNHISYKLSDLPEQKFPKKETFFIGTVSSVFSPYRFYVQPSVSFSCPTERKLTDKELPLNEGTEFLTYTEEILSQFMAYKMECYQSFSYKKGDLVLVLTSLENSADLDNDHQKCCRAYVLKRKESNLSSISNGVKVFLIDYGLEKFVQDTNVALMPKKFTLIAPMAYRCKLEDIRSVGSIYSPVAVAEFKSLVFKKEVLVNWVERVKFPDAKKILRGDSDEAYEDFTHNVRIAPRPNFHFVSEGLSKKGYGILLNNFPFRSSVNSRLKISHQSKNLFRPNFLKVAETQEKVIKREIERMAIRRVFLYNDATIDGVVNTTEWNRDTFDVQCSASVVLPKDVAEKGILIPEILKENSVEKESTNETEKTEQVTK